MNELLTLLSFPCGLLIGGIFFGGLWLTVQYGITSKYPSLWFFVSFIIRLSIAGVGFYFVTDKNMVNLLFCLAGFLLSRFLISRLTRPSSVKGGEQ